MKKRVVEFYIENGTDFFGSGDTQTYMENQGYHVVKWIGPKGVESPHTSNDIRKWMKEQGIDALDHFAYLDNWYFTHAHNAILFRLTWGV